MNCPHGPCHCHTTDGTYCGDYCRHLAGAGVVSERCECGHVECAEVTI
jgi:hypothetical protein